MKAARLLLLLPLCVLAAPASSADEIKLTPIKFDGFKARLAANPQKAKYTLVDAWATNCAPCKENFPHLVLMHDKFAKKGLAVISLSLDEPEDTQALKDALVFLKDKHAAFENFYIDEENGAGFEKLGVNGIPAVFLYGPDGKELKRFTMDDPDDQFTYDEVEAYVAAILDGKTPPSGKAASR